MIVRRSLDYATVVGGAGFEALACNGGRDGERVGRGECEALIEGETGRRLQGIDPAAQVGGDQGGEGGGPDRAGSSHISPAPSDALPKVGHRAPGTIWMSKISSTPVVNSNVAT